MTPEEIQEWESRKFSHHALLVYALDSGRFVVAEQDRTVLRICDTRIDVEVALRWARDRDPPPYNPPHKRPLIILDDLDLDPAAAGSTIAAA